MHRLYLNLPCCHSNYKVRSHKVTPLANVEKLTITYKYMYKYSLVAYQHSLSLRQFARLCVLSPVVWEQQLQLLDDVWLQWRAWKYPSLTTTARGQWRHTVVRSAAARRSTPAAFTPRAPSRRPDRTCTGKWWWTRNCKTHSKLRTHAVHRTLRLNTLFYILKD